MLLAGCGAPVVTATSIPTTSIPTTSIPTTTTSMSPTTVTAPQDPTVELVSAGPQDGSSAVDLSGVVVAGECVTVAFTPASASVEQLGELCTPSGAVEDTTILLVHGGAGVSGDRTDLTAWQEWYAERGYMTLSVDYALVDPETDDGLYPLPELNVTAGVQYLRAVGATVGATSLVVQGHSAGARLAAIVATGGVDVDDGNAELWGGVPTTVDGTVGFYGYYDGAQFNGEAYYGGDGTPPDGASAIANAAAVSGWTMLVHGTADSIIDVSASEQYAAALGAVGAEVDLVEIAGAEHGLDGYDVEELTEVGQQVAELVVEQIERSAVG